MRLVAVLVLAAACGGSSKPMAEMAKPVGPPVDPIPSSPGSECQVVAENVAVVILASKAAEQPAYAAEVRQRCSRDQWSDEARNCFATAENDAEARGCAKHLTDTQRAGLDLHEDEADAGGAAPAASPAPGASPTKARTTRGPTRGPSRTSDPCEGGEAKADPCEGGE